MAQDLTAKKSNFASTGITIADRILQLARDCDELDASYFANGFNGGGANAIVQADLMGANAHLTPTILTNIITAVEAIKSATPQGTRDNLRQAIPGGLP